MFSRKLFGLPRYGCQAVSPTVKIFLGWHIICNFGQTHGMGPGIRGAGSLPFWLLDRQTTSSVNLRSMLSSQGLFSSSSFKVSGIDADKLDSLNDPAIFGNLIYKHQDLFLRSAAVFTLICKWALLAETGGEFYGRASAINRVRKVPFTVELEAIS